MKTLATIRAAVPLPATATAPFQNSAVKAHAYGPVMAEKLTRAGRFRWLVWRAA